MRRVPKRSLKIEVPELSKKFRDFFYGSEAWGPLPLIP